MRYPIFIINMFIFIGLVIIGIVGEGLMGPLVIVGLLILVNFVLGFVFLFLSLFNERLRGLPVQFFLSGAMLLVVGVGTCLIAAKF
jgi:hypothetical protein